MTKHEADVIGGLNMTDQISNEAYKQIMIAAQDENEVGDVLDEIRAEIENDWQLKKYPSSPFSCGLRRTSIRQKVRIRNDKRRVYGYCLR